MINIDIAIHYCYTLNTNYLNERRKQMKKEKQNVNGITLISLVITVIVLLILAGVAVSIGLNENEVFEKAENAKTSWNIDVLKEEISLAMNLYYDMPTLKEKLEKINGADVKNVNENQDKGISGVPDVCIVTKDNMQVTVYSNGDILDGKVEIWDGESSEIPEMKQEGSAWNWYIYTPSQLKFLADYINNGQEFTTDQITMANEQTVTLNKLTNTSRVFLMNNIDMGAREGTGTTIEEKWETDANKAVRWTPIGNCNPGDNSSKYGFSCGFFGNNHTITGVYVNEYEEVTGSAGLFGGTTTSVRNLTLKNSYIKRKIICWRNSCIRKCQI